MRDEAYPPVSAKALALQLPPASYRRVTWREGTNTALTSRFAAVRVCAAHRHRPRPEEWLLIEWPAGDAEPFKYFLSTLAAHTPLKALVRVAKLRWRIERDYQELKQELGLGHFEGRGWRGFHHHATLCIAAYGFLVAQRLGAKKTAAPAFLRQKPALPKNFRPRGAPASTAPRRRLARHAAPDARHRAGRTT